MPKRKSCRKFYKELRDNLAKEQLIAKSRAICRRVLESNEYKRAEIIFAYYPLGNEVNCLPVIEQALEEGKRVVLPRCCLDCQMDFYEIKSLADVKEGHFHVMEPKEDCKRFEIIGNSMIPNEWEQENMPDSKMLALVPGVVFDRLGNRYGYGKGYYDRYFARFRQLNRMALAYTGQISEHLLECLDTDMKMHIIVTEDEVLCIDG